MEEYIIDEAHENKFKVKINVYRFIHTNINDLFGKKRGGHKTRFYFKIIHKDVNKCIKTSSNEKIE